MGLTTFSIGRDTQLVVMGPNGRVDMSHVTGFESRQLSSTLAILRWSCGVAEGVCYAIAQAAWEFLHVWEFAGD